MPICLRVYAGSVKLCNHVICHSFALFFQLLYQSRVGINRG